MREAFKRSSSSRFLAFFADPSLIREYPCVPPCGTRVPKNKKSAGECLSVLVRVCLRLSSFFLSSVVCPLISGFWKRLIAQAGLLVKQRRLFRGSSLRSQHGAEGMEYGVESWRSEA